MARRARMHPADVGKLEAGKVWPYPGWRRRLARALGWPLSRGGELFEEVDTHAPVGAR